MRCDKPGIRSYLKAKFMPNGPRRQTNLRSSGMFLVEVMLRIFSDG